MTGDWRMNVEEGRSPLKWRAYHLYWWWGETSLAIIREQPEYSLDLSTYRMQPLKWRARHMYCTHRVQYVGFMVNQYDTSVPRVTHHNKSKWNQPMRLCHTKWPLLISHLLPPYHTNHPHTADACHDCCVGKPYQHLLPPQEWFLF